jgi:hypothetical protein
MTLVPPPPKKKSNERLTIKILSAIHMYEYVMPQGCTVHQTLYIVLCAIHMHWHYMHVLRGYIYSRVPAQHDFSLGWLEKI